jgi:hypothetical protein
MQTAMQNPSERRFGKEGFATPVILTQPEPWQWEILANAFLHDPTLNFWLGEQTSLTSLLDFFEAVVMDTFASGGTIFSASDRKTVLVWTRLGYSQETPSEWKHRWYNALGPEGVKRYYWLYEAGELGLDSARLKNCMLPDYLGRSNESTQVGSGIHLGGWTIDYFTKLGFEVPFILASTIQAARIYSRAYNYHIHKQVFQEGSPVPVGTFLKRNMP